MSRYCIMFIQRHKNDESSHSCCIAAPKTRTIHPFASPGVSRRRLPRHNACAGGHARLARALAAAAADLRAAGPLGDTPLSLAAERGDDPALVFPALRSPPLFPTGDGQLAAVSSQVGYSAAPGEFLRCSFELRAICNLDFFVEGQGALSTYLGLRKNL